MVPARASFRRVLVSESRGLESQEYDGFYITVSDGALGNVAIAQKILLAPGVEDWNCELVSIEVRRQSSLDCTDFEARLCADDGGEPGTVLGVGVFDTITVDRLWHTATVSPAVTLSATTPVWMVLARTGNAVDLDHYVEVTCGETFRYLRGGLMWLRGGVWSAGDRVPTFMLAGWEETTTTLGAMLSGQFVAGVDVAAASGVRLCPWRSGDRTRLQESLDLLSAGTSGGVRLLATMGRDRRVRIEAAPAKSAVLQAGQGRPAIWFEPGNYAG